ncbi:MAG TPA: hypothetical protein DEQ98_09615 [Acidobacteria bacterium]|nr:hypothetical protein [Acidobacteriota bacterium]HCE03487.1 hypothetical protein [Acidobacteriota bacterium]
MVRFLNRSRPTDQHVTVWCEAGDDGFHLMRRELGGDLHTERLPNRSALYAATVRLQAALIRSGWTPIDRAETAAARRRTVRSGHFHR